MISTPWPRQATWSTVSRGRGLNALIPHNDDETRFWNEKNLQGVCKICHSLKTRFEEAIAIPKPVGLDAGRKGRSVRRAKNDRPYTPSRSSWLARLSWSCLDVGGLGHARRCLLDLSTHRMVEEGRKGQPPLAQTGDKVDSEEDKAGARRKNFVNDGKEIWRMLQLTEPQRGRLLTNSSYKSKFKGVPRFYWLSHLSSAGRASAL